MLALVFMIIYSAFILFINLRQYNDLIMKESTYKSETVRGMIAGYKKTADEVGGRFWNEKNAAVRLMTIRLRNQAANGEFSGVRYGEDGMVVRVRNGQVELPPEAEGLFAGVTPEMVTNEYTQTRTKMLTPAGSGSTESDSREVILTGGRIDGEWYYLSWTLDDEWYFGVTKASDKALYLYLTDSTGMSRAGILFALATGVLFLIIYVLTAKFALKDYTDKYYKRNASGIAKSAEKYIGKIEKRSPYPLSAAARTLSSFSRSWYSAVCTTWRIMKEVRYWDSFIVFSTM